MSGTSNDGSFPEYEQIDQRFKQIYDDTKPGLINVVLRYRVFSQEDAEDIVQEAFTRCYIMIRNKLLTKQEEIRSVGGYLRTTVRNIIRDRLRVQKRHSDLGGDKAEKYIDAQEDEDPLCDPEEVAMKRDLDERTKRVITEAQERLAPNLSTVIEGELQGKTFEEIGKEASTKGIGVPAVRVRRKQALAELRNDPEVQEIAEEYFSKPFPQDDQSEPD